MEQIFKVLELIMNVTSAKSQTISKQLATTIRKIIMFVIIALGSMALFCVGVTLVVTNMAEQYDKNATIFWNGSLTLGSILATASFFTFLYFLSQKAWLTAASIPNSEKKTTPSPIEEALGILIKDIVVERQIKRETAQTTENPTL